MTTENAAATDTAGAVAGQGVTVAPEKASSKKAASAKKGAPKRQKIVNAGRPNATSLDAMTKTVIVKRL